jgi:hypothetical protein
MWPIDHPIILAVLTIACLPALWPLARFFFDDLESFLDEAGLSREHDRWLWILGFPRYGLHLHSKIIGFVGFFVILVGLSYLSIIWLIF